MNQLRLPRQISLWATTIAAAGDIKN